MTTVSISAFAIRSTECVELNRNACADGMRCSAMLPDIADIGVFRQRCTTQKLLTEVHNPVSSRDISVAAVHIHVRLANRIYSDWQACRRNR